MVTWTDEQVHVSHDGDALLIHISGSIGEASPIESKNSPPAVDEVRAPLEVPYSARWWIIDQGAPAGRSVLRPDPTTEGTGLPVKHFTIATILGGGSDYARWSPATGCPGDPDVVPLDQPALLPNTETRLRRADGHRDHARGLRRLGGAVVDVADGVRQ